MLGERPLSFYRRIKRLPNVVLVDPFMHNDPRPFVEHAEGVVTITGTSAFESALLGKPSIIFGPTPFAMLKSVRSMSDVTKLPQVLRSWKNEISDDLELEAYLDVAISFGEEIFTSILNTRESENDPSKAHAEAVKMHRLLKKGEELARLEISQSEFPADASIPS
jgi:hypothetical protein